MSGTTRVSRYQKGKTNLDFTEARDSEWQWHQLGHMQVCIPLQTDNHASTPPLTAAVREAKEKTGEEDLVVEAALGRHLNTGCNNYKSHTFVDDTHADGDDVL